MAANKQQNDLIKTQGNTNDAKPILVFVHNAFTKKIYKRDDRALHAKLFRDLADGRLYGPKTKSRA